jgi:hypothetical protein
MDERAQQTGSRQPLEVRAGLREPPADAFGLSEPEAMTHKRVHVDAARDDVAAGALPRDVELLERLSCHQRQLVATPAPAERAATRRIAISLEPTAGERRDLVDAMELGLGRRRDQQGRNRPGGGRLAVRPVVSERKVERRDRPALGDLAAGRERPRRIRQRAGGRAEHDDRVIPVAAADAGDPAARPGEVRRVGDRDEPEVPLVQPLADEEQVAVGRRLTGDLRERGPQFVREQVYAATSLSFAESASARSFFRLWFSIWRIRSRVTLKVRPTSSSVRGCSPFRP